MYAERELKGLYQDKEKLRTLRFEAAQREFEPEENGVSSSGLNTRCPRGMQWIGEICGKWYSSFFLKWVWQICQIC